jgi:hypothetical protein
VYAIAGTLITSGFWIGSKVASAVEILVRVGADPSAPAVVDPSAYRVAPIVGISSGAVDAELRSDTEITEELELITDTK